MPPAGPLPSPANAYSRLWFQPVDAKLVELQLFERSSRQIDLQFKCHHTMNKGFLEGDSVLRAITQASFVIGCGLITFACAVAQQVAEFEDEPVIAPDSSRFKSASNGVRARVSQYNVAQSPVSSPVPVLLPADTQLLRRLHFMADGSSYTAFLPQDDITLSVFGTRRVAVVGEAPSSQRHLGEGISYSIQKTESGFQVGFKEFGANYLVSVECRKRSDVRCLKPTFVLQIGQGLSVYEAE